MTIRSEQVVGVQRGHKTVARWRGARRFGDIALCNVAVAAILFAGCRDNEDAVLCTRDSDCAQTCMTAPVSRLGYCAVAARGCQTQWRWDDSAGDELAGQCVALDTIDAGVADSASPTAVGGEL